MKRPPRKKRSYHHGDLRRALIDAALSLVTEGGIDALTLREAARKAGVSHSAPYRHFSDKESMLVAIALEGFERLADSLEAADGVAGDDLARFIAGGHAYVRFALANAAHYRVMFGPALAHRIGQYPDLDVAGMRAFRGLLDLVERAGHRGLLRDDVPHEMVATTIWAYVHGLCMLVLDGHLPLDEPAMIELTTMTARNALEP